MHARSDKIRTQHPLTPPKFTLSAEADTTRASTSPVRSPFPNRPPLVRGARNLESLVPPKEEGNRSRKSDTKTAELLPRFHT